MKMKIRITAALLMVLVTNSAVAEPICGNLDTEAILRDLERPFRVDREWHEMLITKLVRQIECEKRSKYCRTLHDQSETPCAVSAWCENGECYDVRRLPRQ